MAASSARLDVRSVKRAIGVAGALLGAAALFFATYYPERKIELWVLALASVAALGFFFVTERRALARLPRSRAARHGANTAAMILAFAGILFLVNFLADRHNRTWDVTAGRLHTLSRQSQKVLKALQKDVAVTAFYADGTAPREEMKRLLDGYRSETARIKVTFVDPDKSPELARQYGIREYGTTVFASGEQTYRLNVASEEGVTNAIVRVTREGKKTIYFLAGHGEHTLDDTQRSGYSGARKALEDQGFAVKELLLLRQPEIPADCEELVVGGPTKVLLEAEVDAVRAYLRRGGKVLLMIDPGVDVGLGPLLADWGVVLHDDIIIDTMSRLFGGSYTTPILTEYPPHEMTKDMRDPTLLPLARSLDKAGELPSGVTYAPLARTSPQSWGETDVKAEKAAFDAAADHKGPLTVAALFGRKQGDQHPELLVVGDSDFADNTYINSAGNGDLFLNMASYLAKEEDLISIRPKDTKPTPLLLSRAQAATLFYTTVVLAPLGLVLAGVTIWVKRRRL